MAHIPPLALQDVDAGLRARLQEMERSIGYIPRGQQTMARMPDLVDAVQVMLAAVHSGSIEQELISLVALASDIAAGCAHSQSHAAFGAARRGFAIEKVRAVYDFENSDLLTAREKAALRLAR